MFVSSGNLIDSDWGEIPKAVLEPRKGTKIDEAEIIEFARERLSKYKRPRKVIIVDDIPKNTIGKVDIKMVRRLYGDK